MQEEITLSFGQNLQYLRRMRRGMTQEALAEKLQVTRQTVSKWEMGDAFPEMDKAVALSRLFACSLDDLLLRELGADDDACTCLRVERVPGFRYVRYTVISADPENDALRHVQRLAETLGIPEPQVIGWDFPFVSQEQTNVYHMHGYTAALLLPQQHDGAALPVESQPQADYAALTIRDPFAAPFTRIPNGYRTLTRYLEMNGLTARTRGVLPCFERTFAKDGVTCMDVFIAVEGSGPER